MKSWAASSREGAWSTGGYGDTGCWRMEIRFQCTWTTGALAKGYYQTYPWPWKGGGGLCQAQNSLCSEWSTEIIIAARTDFLQKETPKQNVLNISESGVLLWHLFNLETDTWRFTKGEQSKSKLAIDGCFESISFSRSLSHTRAHTDACVCAHLSLLSSLLSLFPKPSLKNAHPQLSLHWLVWAPHDWSRQSPSLPTVQNSKGMQDKTVRSAHWCASVFACTIREVFTFFLFQRCLDLSVSLRDVYSVSNLWWTSRSLIRKGALWKLLSVPTSICGIIITSLKVVCRQFDVDLALASSRTDRKLMGPDPVCQ